MTTGFYRQHQRPSWRFSKLAQTRRAGSMPALPMPADASDREFGAVFFALGFG